MATYTFVKIYKGIKRRFVRKREMQIGSPTDVKHLAHIGLGDDSARGPSWMSQFKSAPEFKETSLGDNGSVQCPSSSVSCISGDQQSPTFKLSVEISSIDQTDATPPPRKRAKKNKATSTSSTLKTGTSSAEICTVPRKRGKRLKPVSTSSTSTLSTEITNGETRTIPKKRKKKASGASSPTQRSSKHSKTKADHVELQ